MNLLFVLLLVSFTLVYPTRTFAHDADAFTVLFNNTPSSPNPISQSIETKNLNLTEDVMQNPFLVNTPITFQIESQERTEEAITWEFSNGKTFKGKSGSVLFDAPGSYRVTIHQLTPDKQNVHTVLIHVIPSISYIPAKAEIFINGERLPSSSIAEIDLSQNIRLQASPDSSNKQQIVTYQWVLDDGEMKEGASIDARLSNNPYLITPILRIVDQYGLITDIQFTLKNSSLNKHPNQPSLLFSGIVAILFLGIVGSLLLLWKRKSKRKS